MRRIWLVNLVLAGALAVAGARLGAFLRAPLPDVPGAAAPAAPAAAPAEPAAGAQEERPGNYEEIVSRDLFSQSRGAPPPPVKTAAEQVPAARPVPPPKLTLYGVVMVDGERSAFLHEGGPETKPRKVREGDAFAGGKVASIRADGVTLRLASGEVSVPLRTPKEGGAPSLPGAPALLPQPAGARPQPQPPVRAPVAQQPPARPGRPVPVKPGAPGVAAPFPVEEPLEEDYFQEDLENGEDLLDEGDVEEGFEEDLPEGE